MRTPEISGSWTGEFVGTVDGGIVLELSQTRSHITGTAHMHEPSLGRLAYNVAGDANEGDLFQFTLSRKQGSAPFSTIHILCWLEANGSLAGRWQAEGGKQGAFLATRLTPFASSESSSPPTTIPPPTRATPRTKPSLPQPPPERPSKPSAARAPGKAALSLRKPVVLVCGNDPALKQTIGRYLEKIGAVATEIDKPVADRLEHIATHAGFAVVLMTPDDIAHPAGKPEEKKKRPSQDIVWELGYLTAKLGRKKLLVLTQGDLATPADVLGLGYEPIDQGEGWKLRLARELKTAGFQVDLNGAL